MPIDGMYGRVMTDAAVELIRLDERKQVVKEIEKLVCEMSAVPLRTATEADVAILPHSNKLIAALRDFAHRIAALAVQEVERERDIWHDNAMHEKRHAERARAQLATAKREGANEALSRICWEVPVPRYVEDIRKFRDREYPATPSPEARVTSEMVERAMKADGFNYAMAGNKELERETREFYRHILTAALSEATNG